MNEDATMLGAVDQGRCHLVLKGRVTYANCQGLDAFIARTLADVGITDIVVDLCETSYLDSTVLGLLATIAAGLQAKNGHRVVLISSQEDVTLLLRSLGFDRVFDMVEHAGETGADSLRPIDNVNPGNRQSVHVLLRAHRALMELNEENRSRFQSVVSCLEEEART